MKLDKRKIVGLYAVAVGAAMIITWCVFFVTGNIMGAVPPAAGLGWHIAAELLAGALLMAAGAATLVRYGWGPRLYLLGMGMLIYAVINGPSYYPGPEARLLRLVFAAAALVAVIFAGLGFGIDD